MARRLIEFNSYEADTVPYSGYNSTKTVIGPMIKKFTGSSTSDYYIGPPGITFRNFNQDTGINPWGGLYAIRYTDRYDIIFSTYAIGGAVTLRITAHLFDKINYTYTYLGQIITNTHANNGQATAWSSGYATLDFYTAGTVSVSGNTVIGSNTNWGENQICAGSRIGFGSTDPSQITTWYELLGVPLQTNRVNNTSWAVEVDSSGRTYVAGGAFTNYTYLGTAYTATRIIRLNPNGTPDLTFRTGAGFNGNVRRIKIDPINPSKVYFAGDFTTYSGASVNYLTRLNASDGSIDTTWTGGTGFNNAVYDIDIDSQGRIYATGTFTTYNSIAVVKLCRLTSGGTLDTSFSGYSPGLVYQTGVSSVGYCLAVEPVTDKLYVGGLFDRWGGVIFNTNYTGPYPVIRLNTNGTIDFTYSAATYFNNYPTTIVPDKFGSGVYIGGQFTVYSSQTNNYIIKTTSGGTKDTSFDNTTAFNSNVFKIRQTNDDRLFVGGVFTAYKSRAPYYLTKLDSAGNVDTSFSAETDTNGLRWLNGIGNLSDGFAIDSTNGRVYATNQTTTQAFGGLIAYESGGTINEFFYGKDIQQLSLTVTASTFSAGTPYVIEDLRINFVRATGFFNWNAYSGFFQLRGLKLSDFTTGSTTINSTTTTYYNNQSRSCYWMPDTLQYSLISTPYVVALDEKINWNSQLAYFNRLDGFGITCFDIRKRVRTTSTSTIGYNLDYVVLATATSIDSGFSTYNNMIIAKTLSGSSSNIKSLYYLKTTGVRQVPIENIQNAVNFNSLIGTTFMTEIPPGNTTTYPLTSSIYQVCYMPEIDRFIITTNGSTTKSYITSYDSNLIAPSLTNTFWSRETYNELSYKNSFERAFLVNGQQLQGPLSDLNAPKYPDTQGNNAPFITCNEGWLHYCRYVSSNENIMYSIPLAADGEYVSVSNNAIITPKYVIPNLISITGMYINTLKEIGGSVFSQSPEPIFIDFRTTGIDDNSGQWINFRNIDDLNGLLCNNTTNNVTIQFRFRFRVAGINCNPNRLYGFSFSYEDDTTDSHYAASVSQSNLTNKIFAWQQVETFGGNIPNLKVRVYNANTGNIILYDTVEDSNLGTWQYSTNGVSWNSWVSSADTVGNYIRYTADYLPSNYKLRVGLNTV